MRMPLSHAYDGRREIKGCSCEPSLGKDMGVRLLAPVPAVLLKTALETCLAQGRVAFGTNAWKVFSKLASEYGAPLPVLIYATHHYCHPDRFCNPSFATFRGIYGRGGCAGDVDAHAVHCRPVAQACCAPAFLRESLPADDRA